jgi:hypothetical protein
MMLARRVTLVLLMLWLPLQGVVAVAMPLCPHSLGHPGVSSQPQAGHEHHSHGRHSSAADSHAGHDPTSSERSNLNCNGCGGCHLACAPAVPAATNLAFGSADPIYSPLYSTLVRLFIPEQPQPPPNSSI